MLPSKAVRMEPVIFFNSGCIWVNAQACSSRMHSSNTAGWLLFAAKDEADDMCEAAGGGWTWKARDTLGQWKRSWMCEQGPSALLLARNFATASTLANLADNTCSAKGKFAVCPAFRYEENAKRKNLPSFIPRQVLRYAPLPMPTSGTSQSRTG